MAANGQQQTKTRPVVFVGLGSTGAKIVASIESRLHNDPFAKRYYRYLAITSETSREEGVGSVITVDSLASQGLSSRAAIEALMSNSESKAEFSKLWYVDPETKKPLVPEIPTLETGVGGSRNIGRAALHYRGLQPPTERDDLVTSLRKLKEDIVRKIWDDKTKGDSDARIQAANMAEQVDCYVFGLLAGGTCSGIALDIAFLIRAALGYDTYLFGVFLLGDVCYEGKSAFELSPAIRQRQKSNTLYALAELSVVQSKLGFDVVKEEWTRRIGRLVLSEQDAVGDRPPFYSVTLVGAKNQAGYSFAMGGDQFRPYWEFLAEYYSAFFRSRAARTQIARTVDEIRAIVDENLRRYPDRPNCFQRVGYVCVRVPAQKILALVRHEISEQIGVNCFKNGDPARIQECQDRFYGETGWQALTSEQSPFAPPAQNEPAICADADLPDTARDFEDAWNQTLSSVKDFYANWTSPDSPAVRVATRGFEAKWRGVFDQVLKDLLGQVAESPLSLGSLGSVISNLGSAVDQRMREVRNATPVLQERMVALEKRFAETLADETKDFPPKSLLNIRKRRFWPGAESVASALHDYRNTLRTYAIHVVAVAALEPLAEELRILGVVRKLIAGHAAKSVFEQQAKALADAFSGESRDPMSQEVISDREEVRKFIVEPILSRLGTEQPGDADTLRDKAIRLVRISWSGDDQAGIWRTWQNIAGFMRQTHKVLEAEHLRKVDPVRPEVDNLQRALVRHFDERVNEVFGEIVTALSVWDTIRFYVENVQEGGADPDMVLKNLFKVFLQQAAHFPRLNAALARRDTFTPDPKVLYVCNTQDAADCFRALGLPEPESYLTQLMGYALGGGSAPMGDKTSPRDRIQFFHMLLGELPYHLEGFEEVTNLLKNPPVERRGDEQNWSDARFPLRWIPQWHARAEKLHAKDENKRPYMIEE